MIPNNFDAMHGQLNVLGKSFWQIGTIGTMSAHAHSGRRRVMRDIFVKIAAKGTRGRGTNSPKGVQDIL